MANKSNAPLVVRDLCKNYPSFQLKPLSFELEAGKITGFIGRNGAGKTTTINAVLSLIRPDGGEVTFCGLDRQEHAREVMEKTGFVLGDKILVSVDGKDILIRRYWKTLL